MRVLVTCVYLKLGADAHSRARQAKSTAAYTSRKKMVTILAMVLSFPEKSTSYRDRTKQRRGETKKKRGREERLTFIATRHPKVGQTSAL